MFNEFEDEYNNYGYGYDPEYLKDVIIDPNIGFGGMRYGGLQKPSLSDALIRGATGIGKKAVVNAGKNALAEALGIGGEAGAGAAGSGVLYGPGGEAVATAIPEGFYGAGGASTTSGGIGGALSAAAPVAVVAASPFVAKWLGEDVFGIGDKHPKREFNLDELVQAPEINSGTANRADELESLIPGFYSLPEDQKRSFLNQAYEAGVLALPGYAGEGNRKKEYLSFRLPERGDGENKVWSYGSQLPTMEELEKYRIQLEPEKYEKYKNILSAIEGLR